MIMLYTRNHTNNYEYYLYSYEYTALVLMSKEKPG